LAEHHSDDGVVVIGLWRFGGAMAERRLRAKYGITLVGVKSPRMDFPYAQATTPIAGDDLLIVSGPTKLVEAFAALT